ncbi:hypothetical protein QNH02_gp20 [Escherichia phage vB_EcoP_Bp7]|nr:hypothetical protein QNH02_gp20 [Escherichia phage vB_EcoP_Bp7]QDJ96604.1 hypothetical protein vBEcoP_Bp726 [Escherichia phage vB_EcoP_Bp7]
MTQTVGSGPIFGLPALPCGLFLGQKMRREVTNTESKIGEFL